MNNCGATKRISDVQRHYCRFEKGHQGPHDCVCGHRWEAAK